MAVTATQTPAPGESLVFHQGDTVRFELAISEPRSGQAWLRTTLGHAREQRQDIIESVEQGTPPRNRDWHDWPMTPTGPRTYELTMPLHEIGTFRAKTLFSTDGSRDLLWPDGSDTLVKVEPADSCAANTVYTAFVRQFLPPTPLPPSVETGRLDAAGYTVIPPSGTFRALIERIPFIVGELGFRIVQLLPIHPVPTTYARMGRFGSPFAALDLKGIDPSLAVFDRKTTPLDQFRELIDAVHAHSARLWIDLPLNHTGWASRLQTRRPDWFVRDEQRRFRSPGAWGVTWEDLSELDYSRRDLWGYMADAILYWCRLGVDGFRCDAGYMIPAEAWRYISARVRREFPATMFLLEGLGGRWNVVEALVREKGLNWAYSELFQSYSRAEIEHVARFSDEFARRCGALIHFCETHDNNRLASVSAEYSRMRTGLCALLSEQGAFGLTNGVEWLATEKIDVHGAPSLRWGETPNQTEHVAALCRLLREHPVFGRNARLRLLAHDEPEVVAAWRSVDHGVSALALVNLDAARPRTVTLNLENVAPSGARWVSRLPSDVALHGAVSRLQAHLPPGATALFEAVTADTPPGDERDGTPSWAGEPSAVVRQRARLLAMTLLRAARPGPAGEPVSFERLDALSGALLDDPLAAIESLFESAGSPEWTRVHLPTDTRRTIPTPRSHTLCFVARTPFRLDLDIAGARQNPSSYSLPSRAGAHIVVIPTASRRRSEAGHAPAARLAYTCALFENGEAKRHEGALLDLPTAFGDALPAPALTGDPALITDHILLTDGRGGYAQVRAAWGRVHSQYDAFWAVNPDPRVPVDRLVLINRWRVWVVRRGYSQDLAPHHVTRVARRGGAAVEWLFDVPTGLGETVPLSIEHRLEAQGTEASLTVTRRNGGERDGVMSDANPIRIVLRPDIDFRSNHAATKAFIGAERAWPNATAPRENGFDFAPDGNTALSLGTSMGRYVHEPEWAYNVELPFERDRGFEGLTDHYSPGYFDFDLCSGDSATLRARRPALQSLAPAQHRNHKPAATPEGDELEGALREAIRDFLARRDESMTVIAGYPWFLDWGRDTLIALRGIVAAGFHEEAFEILDAFARFERDGTLPNTIRGADSSNRDTSDAPLWFIAAAAECCAAAGRPPATVDAGGRTLAEVILSICRGYTNGTVNGIGVDAASGLVFSPSHFTWMDTNYPAGTPREGYPVEIQALWWRALQTAHALAPTAGYDRLAARTRAAILSLFTLPDGRCSDCLHTGPGRPASVATADDHNRPNALFLITLGVLRDHPLARRILGSAQQLLVPGALRSLADEPVSYGLPIFWQGAARNDPHRPYWGRYAGDEDTSRKPAYHNGAAWTWPYPAYAEALSFVYGDRARRSASALLRAAMGLLESGCIGHLPELLDGNAPHEQRGCGAQAWSITELYRVASALKLISNRK